MEKLSEKEPLKEAVDTSATDLLSICEAQGIKVDAPFIKDESHDVRRRWDALSATAEDLLRKAMTQKEVDVEAEISSVEEAIVESEYAVTESEPDNWNMLDLYPRFAADFNVSKITGNKFAKEGIRYRIISYKYRKIQILSVICTLFHLSGIYNLKIRSNIQPES